MKILIIFLFCWSSFAANDFVSSCQTKEMSSFFHLKCRLEMNQKNHDLDFVISKQRFFTGKQSLVFCDNQFMQLDTSFIQFASEHMLHLDKDLFEHLSDVNILDQGNSIIVWGHDGKAYQADFKNKAEQYEVDSGNNGLYAICSDNSSGIFLDIKI